jgi:hypothetical protein
LGFLPMPVISSPVPDWIQDWATIDFARGGTNRPGGKFPPAQSARQDLPGAAEIARSTRQIAPVRFKPPAEKARKTGFSVLHGDTGNGERK